MLTLDNCGEVSGKTVFVRVDLNCPVDKKTNSLENSPRIAAHAETVRELASKGAKVVVLSHQGRKGDPDCISLAQHAKLLESECHLPVQFVPDVAGRRAQDAIKKLQSGSILLLENVRFLEDETKFKTKEEYEKSILVSSLSQFCDLFVLDGFSTSHRAQASVVGFYKKPCAAGRVIQRELLALDKAASPKKPLIFVFGGAKPDDSIGILEKWLSEGKVDKALLSGVIGSLFLHASGVELGRTMEYLSHDKALDCLPKAKELLAKYPEKIVFPSDVAVDSHGTRQELLARELPSPYRIMDIGSGTIETYAQILSSAKTIIINGPAGVYEREEFSVGTEAILSAIENSKAFSLVGGGHTLSAIEKFGIDKSKFGYISLAGKALISYLSGEKLAGVEMLRGK